MCEGRAALFALNWKKTALCYHRCGYCGFVFLADRHIVSRAQEKTRYLLHRNDPPSPGYTDFLRAFLAQALLPYKDPGSRILDFGSGPAPVLAEMLKALGYVCDRYDPIFARTRSWRRRSYDAILLHEVAEHIRSPGSVYSTLAGLIVPGGIIALRTRFLPSSMDEFPGWWYRMDPTHIGFYTAECLTRYFERKGFSLLALARPDIIVFRKEDAPDR